MRRQCDRNDDHIQAIANDDTVCKAWVWANGNVCVDEYVAL